MSVRATERLIGDLVCVSALPKSPHMVVQSVEVDTKMVITTWFSVNNEYQEGCFPASALDRVDQEKTKAPAKSGKPKPKGGRK